MDPFRYNLHQDGGTGGRRGPSPTSTFPNYWPNYGPNMGLSAGMLWHRGPSTLQQIAIASKSASHRVTPTPTGSDCVTVNVWGLLWAVWHAQVLNCRLLPGSCPSVSLGARSCGGSRLAAEAAELAQPGGQWRLAGAGSLAQLAPSCNRVGEARLEVCMDSLELPGSTSPDFAFFSIQLFSTSGRTAGRCRPTHHQCPSAAPLPHCPHGPRAPPGPLLTLEPKLAVTGSKVGLNLGVNLGLKCSHRIKTTRFKFATSCQ